MKNEIGLIQNEIVELRNIQCVPKEKISQYIHFSNFYMACKSKNNKK